METKKQEKVKEDIETVDYDDNTEEDVDDDIDDDIDDFDNENLWE